MKHNPQVLQALDEWNNYMDAQRVCRGIIPYLAKRGGERGRTEGIKMLKRISKYYDLRMVQVFQEIETGFTKI